MFKLSFNFNFLGLFVVFWFKMMYMPPEVALKKANMNFR